MIDLNEMSRVALKIAKVREKKEQLKSDTFSILKHCAGELCEATNSLARWEVIDDEMHNKKLKTDFADELADIITCALIAAAREEIDIEGALLRMQEKNARRAE